MKPNRILTFLWLLAGLVPLCCVWLGGWLFSVSIHRPVPFLTSPHTFMFQSVVAALPYIILAWHATAMRTVLSDRSIRALRFAAGIGLLLTITTWLYYYFQGYIAWRDETHTGANIGLGIFMLASPIIAGIAMFISYRISNREKSTEAN